MTHKKNLLIAVVLSISLFCAGCAIFKNMTASEEQTFDLTLKIAAKHIAIAIAEENPNDVQTFRAVIDQTNAAFNGTGMPVDRAVNTFTTFLLKECKDPVLRSDLNDLLEMLMLGVDTEVIEVTLEELEINKIIEKVQIALKGMQEGLKLAQSK